MLLSAFVKVSPPHPLLPAQLRSVLQAREEGVRIAAPELQGFSPFCVMQIYGQLCLCELHMSTFITITII